MHLQEILNAIYANHHYEYLVVDTQKRIIEYSDGVFTFCSAQEVDCKKMTLFDVIEEMCGLEAEVEHILRAELLAFTLPYVRKNDTRYVHIRLSPGRKREIPHSDGYVYETMIILFEDITEQAQTQQGLIQERNEKALLLEKLEIQNRQLQIYNNEMQRLVKEETSKNIEKQKMVELQSRYSQMGEMIGMITHQWKQPLNVISIVNYILKQKIEQGGYNKHFFLQKLSEIAAQVKFMDQTVGDFHDFFNPSLEKRLFNINETLLLAIELVKPEYEFHNIALKVEGDRDMTAYGYPNEFNQVILVLLKNAKDAFIEDKQDGERHIDITIEEVEGEACVRVKDNAGGIPEELIDKIFDLYVSTKRGGCGLGLNIAKNIIENNMEGVLEVRNSEEGAEFTILLPQRAKK